MELLFDLFGFLDVVLHLVALSSQALEIGGIAFILLVVMPFRVEIGAEADEIMRRCRVLLRWGAGIAIVGAAAYIVINTLLLYGANDVPIADGLTANFAIAEMVRLVASAAIFIPGFEPRDRPRQADRAGRTGGDPADRRRGEQPFDVADDRTDPDGAGRCAASAGRVDLDRRHSLFHHRAGPYA